MAAEVTDYEVRRELIRAGKARGLARLDTFAKRQGILAVDARAWQRAAESWADARREGRPTAGASALDGGGVGARRRRAPHGRCPARDRGRLARHHRDRKHRPPRPIRRRPGLADPGGDPVGTPGDRACSTPAPPSRAERTKWYRPLSPDRRGNEGGPRALAIPWRCPNSRMTSILRDSLPNSRMTPILLPDSLLDSLPNSRMTPILFLTPILFFRIVE